jgi:hypothetical protein
VGLTTCPISINNSGKLPVLPPGTTAAGLCGWSKNQIEGHFDRGMERVARYGLLQRAYNRYRGGGVGQVAPAHLR